MKEHGIIKNQELTILPRETNKDPVTSQLN
jgi:hypothetical protein